MSKSVLISIKPKWCELIASGIKTVEIRKTRPKLATPFKCYIYQTKHREQNGATYSDGKVIGEFICNMILPISIYCNKPEELTPCEIPSYGLTDKEILDYLGNGKTGYGWLISSLVIYETPKKLSEFHYCDICEYGLFCNDDKTCKKKMQRPPQSWCYVEEQT